MPGKDPHRPEGKTADAERMSAIAYEKGLPHQAPSAKEIAEINAREQREHGAPARTSAHHQVGGSRPGVESRVKDAIDAREAREAREGDRGSAGERQEESR